MIAWIDLVARRCVAWPLVLVGYGMTLTASGLIRVGAWLVNVNVSEVE